MKKDLQIVSYNTDTKTYEIKFNLNASTIHGRDLLVQKIVKQILTAAGSNYFEPDYGENFYRLFGTLDVNTAEEVRENFPVMLQNVEDRIISEQSFDSSLQPSEKLLNLNLVSIELDEFAGS